MRRFVAMLGLTGLILVTAVPAMAASPCNGDETGREYAQNHIVELATAEASATAATSQVPTTGIRPACRAPAKGGRLGGAPLRLDTE